MEFKPAISPDLKEMDARIFFEEQNEHESGSDEKRKFEYPCANKESLRLK